MHRSAIITGSSGFLGSRLKALLIEHGYHLTTIDRSAVNSSPRCVSIVGDLSTLNLSHCLPHQEYDVCFHFAGPSSVPNSWDDPLGDFTGGLPGTLNLINFLANKYPACQLLLASSAAVYGNPEFLPVTETSLVAPISPYGIHKALAEQVCIHYARLYSHPLRILRIFSAYGVGLRRQLLWDVSRKLAHASASSQESIPLWGTGMETRDFIHVDDVAEAALCIANTRFDSLVEILNVASGAEITIKEVVRHMCRFWGGDIEPEFQGSNRPGDPTQWRADISPLKDIGFCPAIPFDFGLQCYVHWAIGYFADAQLGYFG